MCVLFLFCLFFCGKSLALMLLMFSAQNYRYCIFVVCRLRVFCATAGGSLLRLLMICACYAGSLFLFCGFVTWFLLFFDKIRPSMMWRVISRPPSHKSWMPTPPCAHLAPLCQCCASVHPSAPICNHLHPSAPIKIFIYQCTHTHPFAPIWVQLFIWKIEKIDKLM